MSRILIIRFLIQTDSDYLTTWFQVAWTITPSYNYPINLYSYILIIPNLGLSIHYIRCSDIQILRHFGLSDWESGLPGCNDPSEKDCEFRAVLTLPLGQARFAVVDTKGIPCRARSILPFQHVQRSYTATFRLFSVVAFIASGNENWGSGFLWSLDWVSEVSGYSA